MTFSHSTPIVPEISLVEQISEKERFRLLNRTMALNHNFFLSSLVLFVAIQGLKVQCHDVRLHSSQVEE